MSTEPTTTTPPPTSVDAPVTATTVDATPVASTVEEPTVVAAPVVEEPTTVDSPIVTEEPVAATTGAAPAPTASKSTTSKRLSLLLGKAKTFVDKKVSDKKPTKKEAITTEVPETTEVTPVVVATEEPIVATTETTEIPTVETTTSVESTEAAAAPVLAEEAHVEKPKNEKRKSILGNIFRSKVIY